MCVCVCEGERQYFCDAKNLTMKILWNEGTIRSLTGFQTLKHKIEIPSSAHSLKQPLELCRST